MLSDAELLRRKQLWKQGRWEIPEGIDTTGFDFNWRPDKFDRPYIHQFGTQWQKTGGPRFVLPEAEGTKYQTAQSVRKLPEPYRFKVLVDYEVDFDWSWHPDDTEPARNYVFGNQCYSAEVMPTVQYCTDAAEEIHYEHSVVATTRPKTENWFIFANIDTARFNFNWIPHPQDPPYIYVWGNQFLMPERMSAVEYRVPGATERKYIDDEIAVIIPDPALWRINATIDKESFDWTWCPHPHDPPYIHTWGNQFLTAEQMPTVEYHVPGATQRKFINDTVVKLVNDPACWKILHEVDRSSFDWDWCPHPWDPPYIYVWGNQFLTAEQMPTVEYQVPGATERKYMTGQQPRLANNRACWHVNYRIDRTNFDWDWCPHPYDPPYIYVWGNQFLAAEESSTVEYHVPGATERKYMHDHVFTVINDPDCWKILREVDRSSFDWTWCPHPWEPPYIYVWGNQFLTGEEMPTVEYHVPGATQRKFINDTVVKLANDPACWATLHPIQDGFDWSWCPHPLDPPYIYTWGNQFLTAEQMPTVEYRAPGATERKYMTDQTPKLVGDRSCWREIAKVDPEVFDWNWCPHPWDPPYIYVWGNKHVPGDLQSTIEYHVPGATQKKYMPEPVLVLPEDDRWTEHVPVDKKLCEQNGFDFSWRPDPREPAFIYVWGNPYEAAEIKPTLEYHVPGATQKKYMGTVYVLPEWDRYNILIPIDDTSFDFSWRPDPREPAYIYVWGNQWHDAITEPTVEYVMPGATERKYMTDRVARAKEDLTLWKIHEPVTNHDFTWRPDPHSPAYIYVWGNKWVPGELRPTLEYVMPGATERKYMGDATVLPDWTKWREFQSVDHSTFDFTWRPDPREPDYIYVWGNKWIPGELQPTLEYEVPGATERKYMGDVEVLPEHDKWKISQEVVNFDFTWRPDPREPAYVYVWGNKWIPGELQPTLEYTVTGATERKYMGDVEVAPEWNRWVEKQPIDRTQFDLSWRPDPREPAYIYVWGNKYVTGELQSTLEYHAPGATEIKYMPEPLEVLPISENWRIHQATENFDFSWRPDPREPDYIYVWGNKWVPGELQPTVEYVVPGATERKYMGSVDVAPEWDRYNILIPVEEHGFDWSWRPDPREPAYIYVWGNQWYDATTEPTVEYVVPGATERKYMTDRIARVKSTSENWSVLIPGAEIDFSWRPDPHSPAYIYVFGNMWNVAPQEPTIEYTVPGAQDRKYVTDIVASLRPDPTNAAWRKLVPVQSFDWSWRPDPHDPPYIYVFGNTWNDAASEPTVEYVVPGATERKYMTHPVAVPGIEMDRWQVSIAGDLETFDFTWRPNPHSPPQIYQWENNGPCYTVPGASEVVLMKRQDPQAQRVPRYYIETTLENLIAQHATEVFWAMNRNLDYSEFDFDWKPDDTNFRHINVFGNRLSADTQTYYVNGPMWNMGHRQINYVDDQELTQDQDLLITQRIILDMFYVDVGGDPAQFDALQERFPNIQRIRYLNSWRDTVLRCAKKATTKFVWVLNSKTDYSNFEFDWYPADWQQKMVHVFGSQWSHWGNTYLINAETFPTDIEYIERIEHLRNINHVRGKRIPVTGCVHDIVYIDMGNAGQLELLQSVAKTVYTMEYQGSYLGTLRKWLEQNPMLRHKRDYCVWVASSISDYSEFQWSWYSDPYQAEQIHVFASEYDGSRQKFGDTLFVNVAELLKVIDSLDKLENYEHKVNYIGHIAVPRHPHPVLSHECDSQAQALSRMQAGHWPFYELRSLGIGARTAALVPSIWGQEHEKVLVGTAGASQIYVPDNALKVITNEIYDYKQIDRASTLIPSAPLDIIFISNGEPIAESNYEHLVQSCKNRNIPNRIVRVQNVNGRVASQHAAAHAAQTGWYFLVNGKVRVRENFDWAWQPDRLQLPKHYIFNVTNPVNSLEYGHQAIVANNRELTLNTQPRGLDFTLDSLHESVDINCGVALYNTDPWTTWRTAFRESIKLRSNTDDISRYRLRVWTTLADGDHGEWSIRGARDGVEFWESVGGELGKLMQSYDWAWIYDYYKQRYL